MRRPGQRPKPLDVLAALLFLTFSAEAVAGPTHNDALSGDMVNLSGREFFRHYASPDLNHRKDANLYLLGVLDSSEGVAWCDYRHFKTITLQEFVFAYFRKLPEQRLGERASVLIEEALRSNFPCGATP